MKTEDNEDLDLILAYILNKLGSQQRKEVEKRLLEDALFAEEYEREKLLHEYFIDEEASEEIWERVVERYKNDEIFKVRFDLMEHVGEFLEENQIENKQKQIKEKRGGFVVWFNKNKFWLGAMAASIGVFVLVKLMFTDTTKVIVLKESELPVYFRNEKVDGLGFGEFDLPNEGRITQFIIDSKTNDAYPIKYVFTQDSLKLYILSPKDTLDAKKWKIERRQDVFRLLTADSTKTYILVPNGKLNDLK